MDEVIFKLIGEAVKGGFALPVVAWFLWDKWKAREEKREIEEKKRSGEYVSFQEVRALGRDLKDLSQKVYAHLKKEEAEEARFVKIEGKQESLEDKVKTENGHIFSQLKDIHENVSALLSYMGKHTG